MSSASKSCPRCGAPANGNFCASCGISLGASTCSSCGNPLTPGAAYCHHCGEPAGGPGPRRGGPATGPTSPGERPLPWLIAGVLTIVAIAAVVYSLQRRPASTPANMANVGNPAALSGPAPDISNLTPREQFARLNDRVMQAAQINDTTTIFTFWPMALGAYQNLSDTERDVDARYHMATLYLMITQYPEVQALADTILQISPDNLLGFYLQGMLAEYQSDTLGMRTAQADFVKHYQAEIQKQRSEYLDHRPILDSYYREGGGK